MFKQSLRFSFKSYKELESKLVQAGHKKTIPGEF